LEHFTLEDLHRIYIIVPRDDGLGTVNLTVAQMSDRQFRWWVKEKAQREGVRMILPIGRIGHETRLYMLNRLADSGVKIYKLADPKPERERIEP
jgi:hypothetical protein